MDAYPWRFETEPEIVLDEDEFVPAVELAGELEHVRKWPAEHWHLAFQGQLRTVSEADAELLEQPYPRRSRRGGVIHERHYTLAEASELLPHVVELIEKMRSARDRLGDRDAREALSEAGPTNGGGDPGRTVSEGFVELRDSMAGLRALRRRAARPRPRPARLPLHPRRPRGLPVLAGGRGRDRVLARARGRLRGPAAPRRWRLTSFAAPRAPRAS